MPVPGIFQVPEDLPNNADLNTLSPLQLSEDGKRVTSWVFDLVEIAKPSGYNPEIVKTVVSPRLVVVTLPLSFAKRFKLVLYQELALRKRRLGYSKLGILSVSLLVGVMVCVVSGFMALSAKPSDIPVSLKIALRNELTYRYTLSAVQQQQVIKTLNTTLTVETVGETSGTISLPDGLAKGKVRFFNPEANSISLAAGTLVATVNGVGYRVVDKVTVAPTDVATLSAGFADGLVQADQVGQVGNLAGGLGDYKLRSGLRITGMGAISGGSSRIAKAATAQDIEKLKTQLDFEIKEQALQMLDTQLQPGWLRLAAMPQIASRNYALPPIGIENVSGQLRATLTVNIGGQAVAPNDLMRFSSSTLPSGLSSLAGPSNDAQLEQPHFVRIEQTDLGLTLVYARAVQTQKVTESFKNLNGWSGTKAEFEELVRSLQSRPEFEAVITQTILAKDFAGKVKIELLTK